MRVLVVDDDQDIRAVLESTLGFSGFDIVSAPDAATALTMLASEHPDAMVVDVMMPGLDGFELVELLRSRGEMVPVLFLTARDEVADRVRGLKLGADDYVTKPFSVVEVAARLEALVRRAAPTESAQPADRVLRCGDLELDEDRHEVRRGDRHVELSATEFRLLTYLLQNKGRVVTKGQILDHVWNYDFRGDTNVVERFVSNLRRKIDQGGPSLIRTVRGFGYSISAGA